MHQKNIYLIIILLFSTGLFIWGSMFINRGMNDWSIINSDRQKHYQIDENDDFQHLAGQDLPQLRSELKTRQQSIITHLIDQGQYACCLETPCAYCLSELEKLGCDCLEEVIEGRHPCGECIGEILEGHGNRFLAPYFARAIAQEVGRQYVDTLRQIISEKYKLAVDEQI